MKKIIATGIALAITLSAHAGEVSGTEDLPIVANERSDDLAKERERKIEKLEEQHAHLGELERLAVPIGQHGGATREELLPYRFSDTTRLQSMLRDPEWSENWYKIASTIAKVADKEAARDLLEFIKSPASPEGYEREWHRARATAIAALGYTLIDQDVPEVLDFLQKLTDDAFATSLGVKESGRPDVARRNAYYALYVAATDEAVALLEQELSKKRADKEAKTAQPLSVADSGKKDRDSKVEAEIDEIEWYLSDVKRERAGIEPEPSEEIH